MSKYICETCKKDFCEKYRLKAHLSRKRPCKINNDIVEITNNSILRVAKSEGSVFPDSTPLTGNFFKTITELKECSDTRRVILYITHLKDGAIKDYLSEWVYKNYYELKAKRGNLTDRIKVIGNNICYKELMLRYFDAFDIKNNKIEKIPETISALKKLKTLDVSNNDLTDLPNAIGFLENLVRIQLEGNPLKKIK